MTQARRRSRGWLWLLLVAALFVRAVVPQGYMAERDDSGTIAVKVCGAGHVLQIPLAKDEAPGDDRAQPPCAFAGIGTPALPPPLVAGLPIPSAVETAFVVRPPDVPFAAAPVLHPPARGPPLAA